MKYLLAAFRLLTIFPVPEYSRPRNGDSGRAAVWFPFVGLCLGALAAAVFLLAGRFGPPPMAAALALLAWAVMTGGLHLDGLADCCDGIFHPGGSERRLQIMKDPHLGAFGAAGLMLLLLMKYSALVSIAPERAPAALILAASLGRWCILLAGVTRPARADGMGADLHAGLKKSTLILAAPIPLAAAVWLGVPGLLALGAGLAVGLAVRRIARRNLGGVTGDVFGAVVETVETAALTAAALTP
ncbi:MAG: adenosylcobinamide-GDP ribazoletransferase [Anaerolineales bacterium]|nr:adenosylcobinamide-GDP ribazoletransferase [Anaerolineales bacterium]